MACIAALRFVANAAASIISRSDFDSISTISLLSTRRQLCGQDVAAWNYLTGDDQVASAVLLLTATATTCHVIYLLRDRRVWRVPLSPRASAASSRTSPRRGTLPGVTGFATSRQAATTAVCRAPPSARRAALSISQFSRARALPHCDSLDGTFPTWFLG